MISRKFNKIGFAQFCKWFNLLFLTVAACYFLLLPGFSVVRDLSDANIGRPGIPQRAWKLHTSLSPRYEQWARERIASEKAAHLNLYDVPSTEWPIFGSVFYLWATEALQREWEKNHDLTPQAPVVYARSTIEAAKDLIIDSNHHSWVRTHWGSDYMHRENVFFRSLIIAGLTSYENLVGTGEYVPLLRDQVETLARDLDESPLGLLNDYPHECYPIDVLPAIGIIMKADELLGTDHSAFAQRALRAFQGEMLDRRGLIPFRANSTTGQHYSPSRGIGNSHISIFAPALWSDQARSWYSRYERHFWQERWWAVGFREYPKDLDGYNWFFEVDAGPVIGGFSTSGNAFAIAAARVNGRFDHAYMLTAQAIATSWPLPDGTLLGPRVVSDGLHAPYLGEAALMYFMTEMPEPGVDVVQGGSLSGLVYLWLLFYFGGSALLLTLVCFEMRLLRSHSRRLGATTIELALWCFFWFGALCCILLGHFVWGILFTLCGQLFPRWRKKPTRLTEHKGIVHLDELGNFSV